MERPIENTFTKSSTRESFSGSLAAENPTKVLLPFSRIRFPQRFEEIYFQTRSWERNGHTYRRLGVEFYKKLMPNAGDIVNKHFWRRTGEHWVITEFDIPALKTVEEWTKKNERPHLVGLGIMTIPIASNAYEGNWLGAALWFGLNTVWNFYPIILQRYNRNRIRRVIERRERFVQTTHECSGTA